MHIDYRTRRLFDFSTEVTTAETQTFTVMSAE